MNCESARQDIEDFRDGTLNEQTQGRLTEHFAECEHCRARLAQLDRLDSQLHAVMKKSVLPDDFASRIAAAIQKETIGRAEPIRLFWLRQAALLAACLLVLLAFVQFGGRPKPQVSTVHIVAPQATARPFFEPGPADGGIGKPFVITGDGKVPYAGKTRIATSRMIHGTPQLTVEAFAN